MRKALEESFSNSGVKGEVPAPTLGWNARDSLAGMKKGYAIFLDNLFPQASDVRLRAGSEDFATIPVGSATKGLMSYSSPSGVEKLFASNDSGIYDVSAGGDVVAAASACTNGDWRGLMTATPGGTFLWCFNGVDDSRYFDGSTFTVLNGTSTPALTGITSSDIVDACLFKHRLMLVKKNSLSFYYLPADSIAGAASEFPLHSLFQKGGKLVNVATWSADAGEGVDDYFVALTSKGELAIYKGTDPSDATKWALVGVFFVGKPLGNRSMVKVGGDLAILTTLGLWPLSKVVLSANLDKKAAITDIIESAFISAAAASKSLSGWQTTVFSDAAMLLVNVPVGAVDDNFNPSSHQYVMNLSTKAWCRFTGWDAHTLIEHDGELYFSSANKIIKAWTGLDDRGAQIVARAKTAFGRPAPVAGSYKTSLLRPIMTLTDRIDILMGIDVDYEDNIDIETSVTYSSILAKWDEVLWDVAYWPDTFVSNRWRSATSKMGHTTSFRLRFAASGVNMVWNTIDVIVEGGGLMG